MRIVLKFGGTSVATIERIREVAKIVQSYLKNGNEVVVIVSAMAKFTNSLVEYTSYFHTINNNKEYDMVVSSGEQISIGLVAMALEEIEIPARSFLAWQLPIITNNSYANAQICNINTTKLEETLKKGIIPVIAGFQGITTNENVTTLGRGGSDTTAVAIAAELGAKCCYIYTDVDGVYTSDPRIVSDAIKLPYVNFNEMIEMANSGAKVLHCRSVEIAHKYNVNLCVKSSYEETEGTFIVNKENNLENPLISGVIISKNETFIKIIGLKNSILASLILNKLLESSIPLDMISEVCENNNITLMLMVSRDNLETVTKILKNLQSEVKYDNIEINNEVAKISIVGVGIQTHTEIMRKLFQVIINNDINILLMALSDLKISLVVHEDVANLLVNLLHSEYKQYFNKSTHGNFK